MKIKFNKIIDSGNDEKERLLFTVAEPCNLGNFVLALAKKTGDNQISSHLEFIKWLEDADLKSEDIVVIYTHKKGEGVKTIHNDGGQTSFFLFWNLSNNLLTFGDYSIVYFETSWKTIDLSKVVNQKVDISEGD